MIWLTLFLCLLVAFLFAGIEAGLLSINPVRLDHNVRQKKPGALRLKKLLEHPKELLLTVLIVTNLMKIFVLVLISRLLSDPLGPWSYPVTGLLAIPIFIIFLELLPKSLFRRFPYRLLAALSEVLHTVHLLLAPLLAIVSFFGRFLFRKETARDLFIARDELTELTTQIEKNNSLEPEEKTMIQNVVEFRTIQGRDVMFPLSQVTTVSPETPVIDLLALARSRGWDRFPVVAADGKVIGLVRTFEILLDGRLHTTAQHHLRRIITVRTDDPASLIIRKLRAARMSLAVVLDENNRPVGVVRPEDLIDRLISVNVLPSNTARTAAV